VLVLEAMLHSLARFYQPARLRAQPAIFGGSVLLPALFGESGPLRSLGATTERTFGIKLADTWLVQLGRLLLAPLALLGLIGLWLSSGVTRVPVDSRGVLVQRGAFAAPALPPGLHFHAPWPWARIIVVPTERVQELSLGFERDLAGPVLWTEKHFEGEQNLLVGQGEELLTINVPLHYRIRDAVAYLRRAGDARAALESLGYRELLAITTTHTAFGLMTTDRAEIAAALRQNLQAAADHLGLGIEIVFVGLKDIHPPVPVAPAYQDVISAEEQRAALVDLARTYVVQATAAAHVSATQIRLQAETAGTERRSRAQGESARFVAPLAAYRAHPDVFTTRRRLETVEAALADIRQLILVPHELRSRANVYLGFDPASVSPPAVAR
jgi:membrane protease subunit HflK